jgi:hypothetical protein
MPLSEPFTLDDQPDPNASSLAWRCAGCARLYLHHEFVERPSECPSCRSSELQRAGPDSQIE